MAIGGDGEEAEYVRLPFWQPAVYESVFVWAFFNFLLKKQPIRNKRGILAVGLPKAKV
jgi:hypothetical protein